MHPSLTLFTPIPPLIISLHLFIFLLISISLCNLLLSPGGLAWSLAKPRSKTAIPGPSGIPILGLLIPFTSSTPHKLLSHLATTLHAKPLMSFSIGSTRFIISSHPDTAKQILSSPAFANRPVKESAHELLFHRAIGFAPHGHYWRNLRRISATHMFSLKKVTHFSSIRTELGIGLVNRVSSSMNCDELVKVKQLLHLASLDNVMMAVFGKKCGEFGEGEVEGLVSEGYELLGVFNWSDHFPIVKWFDVQGVRRRCRDLVARVGVFVTGIVNEHRERRSQSGGGVDREGDFVDVLLDLESEDEFSESDMIAVLWEMIFRGTDTVAILLEWILARMVLHQDIQARAQSEIDSVVESGRPVSDTDLSNLPYLQAIVKETLRVHPPGPLLSWARLAIHDTQVGPHVVPAGTTAMVNMWAITHDDQIWADPERFNPDRFMSEDVSIMGSDLRLAPFGAGRRVCPGKTMGLATVQLWLAQLLQNFKWVGIVPGLNQVDLSECLKMSLEMKKPLVCKALARVRA